MRLHVTPTEAAWLLHVAHKSREETTLNAKGTLGHYALNELIQKLSRQIETQEKK